MHWVQVTLPGPLKLSQDSPSSMKQPVHFRGVPELALNNQPWVLGNEACPFYGIVMSPEGRGGADHWPDQHIWLNYSLISQLSTRWYFSLNGSEEQRAITRSRARL